MSVRALTFAGTAPAVLYAPGAGSDDLRSEDAAGCVPAEYGLPERLVLSGGSPAAHAFRAPHPLRPTPLALASYPEGCPAPLRVWASLGALLLGANGRRLGCLIVAGAGENGFEADQQHFLERCADAVADVLEAGAEAGVPSAPLSSTLCEPVRIGPDDFDGKADSLLAHVLPEDLHALMSVLDPSVQTAGRREPDFRVRCPAGEMSRLSPRCRVAAGADGRPDQVLGVVTATSVLHRGADRVALAEPRHERLQVTLLAPPQSAARPQAWRLQSPWGWPDAPFSALPALQMTLGDGRMDLWPTGTAFESGLDGIGPGGLAVLSLPAGGQAAGPLPRRLPEIPGGIAVARYLSARRGLQVGGDWYDVIALSEDRVALVIGDVQGHSAAAAAIIGQMRTAVRAYVVEGHPPDVVVSHANRLLVGMETDLFATCCYAGLDMDEGDVLFVRAGHVAPLLRHPDGSTDEVRVEGGLPLGICTEADLPVTAVAPATGTMLALLADGLIEAADLSLDEGMRRTRATLATGREDGDRS